MSGLTWPVLLGAVPSIFGALRALVPSGERGLARRVKRLAEARERLPEGSGRDRVDAALNNLAAELAFGEEQRALRKVDGANIAAIVFVGLLGFGLTWLLWSFGPLVWRVLAIAIALFATLLVTVGGGSRFFTTRDRYQFEGASEARSLAHPE